MIRRSLFEFWNIPTPSHTSRRSFIEEAVWSEPATAAAHEPFQSHSGAGQAARPGRSRNSSWLPDELRGGNAACLSKTNSLSTPKLSGCRHVTPRFIVKRLEWRRSTGAENFPKLAFNIFNIAESKHYPSWSSFHEFIYSFIIHLRVFYYFSLSNPDTNQIHSCILSERFVQ